MSGTRWKEPAVPRHVVQAFVIDKEGLLLLMHRSDKVRSAKNVWSIPSGEHEIGETTSDSICREIFEEYGLEAVKTQMLDLYENIAGDPEPNAEQYHWVISLFLVEVADVTKAINREPDKHDLMVFINYDYLYTDEFLLKYQFHESLQKTLVDMKNIYADAILEFAMFK